VNDVVAALVETAGKGEDLLRAGGDAQPAPLAALTVDDHNSTGHETS
jgi:hypothetical protein